MQGERYLEQVETLADVDRPYTKAGSCTRFAANIVGVEVGITEIVLLTLFHTLQGDFVLITGPQ